MSIEKTNKVSVIDPVGLAIERAKEMLFRPFDWRKWFVIGFCAWLAYLGGNSGGGPGGPNNLESVKKPHEHQAEIVKGIHAAKEYVLENLFWIVPVSIIVTVIIIGISLLITWLNSRGKFMFLHCVATNKAEIAVPWNKFRERANSLFVFRIVLYIIGLFAVALPGLGMTFFIIVTVTGSMPLIASIPGIVISGLFAFVILIGFFLVRKFTFDFVVPIMFLRTTSCMAGWHEFMTIFSGNKARLALYILFQIVIAIAIQTIIVIIFCIGCCFCCTGLLLFVPYIGTVILLPLLVFKRSYSLYYLRQFGPDFDVFLPENETG